MKAICKISALMFLILTMSVFQATAQIMKTHDNEKSEITAFSATPDGKWIALGGKSSIDIINTETDATIYNLPTSIGVKVMCMSQDGNLLVVGFDNQDKSRNLLYWDFQNNIRNQIIHSHTDRILCIALSPDGKLLATGSKDMTIKLFDTKYFKEIRTLPITHTDDITALKFSPDSKFLVSGSKDKTVVLWDLNTNDDLMIYKGHNKKINAVVFSPDSKLIASAGDDRIIRIWDLYKNEKPLYILSGHKDDITAIEFTPDGRFLGSGSKDRTIQIWDYKKSKILDLNNGIGTDMGEVVDYLSFYSNGKLFTCTDNRYLRYWNWGFPILSIRNLKLEDKNQTNKIEGTENVKIKFNIENSGDGNALNLKFNIADLSRVEGLIYPPSSFIETIPARTTYEVEIRVSASSKLVDSKAIFSFNTFQMVSNTPFPLRDTIFPVATVAAPLLIIDSVRFVYPDTSKALTGNKTGTFNIYLKNTGVAMAKDVQVKTTCDKTNLLMDFEDITNFGNIGTASAQILKVPVRATSKTIDGTANFSFEISESTDISHPTEEYTIATKKYNPTLVETIREIVENKIVAWQSKDKWENTEQYKARVTESTRENQISIFTKQTLDSLVQQNLKWSMAVTDYDADNNFFKISIPGFEPIFLRMPLEEAKNFDEKFKNYKLENMRCTVNKDKYAFLHLELVDSSAMNKKYFYNSSDLVAFSPTQLKFNFDPVDINLATSNSPVTSGDYVRRISVGRSDVDINIPEVVVRNSNVYAVIIGNEDYKSNQMGLKSESNVDYAERDAETFSEYLRQTYGVPMENIRLRKNATAASINQDIAWLSTIAANKNGDAELVFYFSGHGLPDENTGEAYLIPVDVTGTNLKLAIKLSTLYAELSKNPTHKVTVFLDACFSGGGRNEGLLAMKKVKIKPKEESISGNMVVFTSSSGDESSGFYKEKQHGMFTYYLLKKIQETKGEIDYQRLYEYLKQEVKLQSVVLNAKEQTPQLIISPDFQIELNTVKIGSKSSEQK